MVEKAGRACILCVDDESDVLEGLKLHLERRFEVVVATSGTEGLEKLHKHTPAVVISDMRMPVMDGAVFLRHVRESMPETSRILLTGQADIRAAAAAVNEGQIFRFLMKPCPPSELLSNVEAAIEHHRSRVEEKNRATEMLAGAVKSLTKQLAIGDPAAYARAERVNLLANDFIQYLSIRAKPTGYGPKGRANSSTPMMPLHQGWAIETAALLSEIGSIVVSPETRDRLNGRTSMGPSEVAALAQIHRLSAEFLMPIPGLELVCDIVRDHALSFDGVNNKPGQPRGENIPWGARVLKLLRDFDDLEFHGESKDAAFENLRRRSGAYDPMLLRFFGERLQVRAGAPDAPAKAQTVSIDGLKAGMILAEDVRAKDGRLVGARGIAVTPGMLEIIDQHWKPVVGLSTPVRVIVK